MEVEILRSLFSASLVLDPLRGVGPRIAVRAITGNYY